jgi:hypothetical protein
MSTNYCEGFWSAGLGSSILRYLGLRWLHPIGRWRVGCQPTSKSLVSLAMASLSFDPFWGLILPPCWFASPSLPRVYQTCRSAAIGRPSCNRTAWWWRYRDERQHAVCTQPSRLRHRHKWPQEEGSWRGGTRNGGNQKGGDGGGEN